MKPDQFITELFGDGWTEAQLPVFLIMLKQMQEDATRYHAIRDALAEEQGIQATQSDLRKFDNHVDIARQSGLI
jgi:hypothetical protein